jgi:hypothetical protein
MELGKHIYIETQRWLPEQHPYRLAKMANHLNGKIETRPKPTLMAIEEQLN